jgi:hypothetical protein
MKTFSDDALAALERGDAIVSASVEIIPVVGPFMDWSTWDHVCDTGSDHGYTPGGISFLGTLGVCYSYGGTFGTYTWTGPLATSIPSGHNIAAIGEIDGFGRFWSNGAVYNRISGSVDPYIVPAPIRLWGGYGDADLPSDEGTSTFKGIGDRGLIQSSSGAIGGTAQNTTLGLSGIEAAALDVLEPNEVKEASVVVRRLIYDSAGKTLLGAYVYSRGRLDELKTSEVIGGSAAIQVSVEGAARGLGRRGGRLRSDADQRLVGSSDGFFRNVSFAAQKTLYWGGKKPAKFG